MGEITNRLGTKINKQPISTKQFVALFVHTKSTIQQTFKNKHAEKSNMGKNSKSNEKHTWIALVAIALFPFPLFFTPKNPQNPPNLRVSSSMPLFQTILSCVPLLCVFRVPLFYASLPVPKKKSLYSYQPLKLNLLKRIHFPFFYFPSFFKNQDAPLFSCRIFSFHMYAATLIPFSS